MAKDGTSLGTQFTKLYYVRNQKNYVYYLEMSRTNHCNVIWKTCLHHKLWIIVCRKLSRSRDRSSQYVFRIKESDEFWGQADAKKAAVLAKYFSAVFKSHPQTDNSNIIEFLNALLQMNICITPTSPDEVKHILQKLNHKKGPSHDLINSKVLLQLPR